MKKNLTLVAGLLVAVSAINIVILTIVADPQALTIRAFRFVITCLLAFYLAKGKNWARLTTAIFCGLGAITSLVGFAVLIQHADQIPIWFLIWGIVMGVIYAFISGFLFMAKSAQRESQQAAEA